MHSLHDGRLTGRVYDVHGRAALGPDVVVRQRVVWRSFFFQAEDGIRYGRVTGVQTCALPIFNGSDTLTVVSTDANGATDSDAVAITVSSVNDGPVNTVPGAQAVNEDTALPIGGRSEERRGGQEGGCRSFLCSGRQSALGADAW